MSKNAKKKLILFLADPALSDDDFATLAHLLEAGDTEEITHAAWQVRKLLRNLDQGSRSQIDKPITSQTLPSNSEEDKVVDEIGRLLLMDQGLSVKEALELLSILSGARESLDPRTSFRRGVERLYNKVGGSRLLSAAHQLRNQSLHGQDSLDWPLLGSSDVGPKKPSK